MKKLFLVSFILLLSGFIFVEKTIAEEEIDPINKAIEKYKDRNFIGCISDLEIFTKTDKTNAVAWYYLGSSYMNIAMKEQANEAFNKVIELNTVPKLTSYSIQAQLCMEDSTRCTYQNFTKEEIEQLKKDPISFLNQYFTPKEPVEKNKNVQEIEDLIDNSDNSKMSQEALKFIKDERLKIQATRINEKK